MGTLEAAPTFLVFFGLPTLGLTLLCAFLRQRFGRRGLWLGIVAISLVGGLVLTLWARAEFPRHYSGSSYLVERMQFAVVTVAALLALPAVVLSMPDSVLSVRNRIVVAGLLGVVIAIASGLWLALGVGCALTGECV